jgi:hypothetical protein
MLKAVPPLLPRLLNHLHIERDVDVISHYTRQARHSKIQTIAALAND